MRLRLLFSVFSIFLSFVCLRVTAENLWPEPRPLGSDYAAYRAPEKPRDDSEAVMQEPTGPLRLSQARALALLRNPELRAFSWEVRAGEVRKLQAGLFPNPEFAVEFENFGGSGDFRGWDSAENTISLSQLIELGGKRSKRRQLATLERLRLAEDLVRLAEDVHMAVSERVKAGKVSPIEETKSSVALAASRIDLERIRRELDASRSRLAATWGSRAPLFELAEGKLEASDSIPSMEQVKDLIEDNPDVARWTVEMAHRLAAVKLEESNRVPDPTLSAGYRRFNETNDRAFVMEISIPLPLFDRNQGATQEARYRLVQVKEQQKAAEIEIHTALTAAYQELAASHVEVHALKDQVLPGAQSAFDATVEGYRQGKFGYLEVLDSQRTLFEAKGRFIRALEGYHFATAEVERLIAVPLDLIGSRSEK